MPSARRLARSPFVCLAPLVLAFGLALTLAACRQNDDPDGSRRLYAEVTQGAGYRAWQRAPGFSGRTPSFTAHAEAVEIFVSPEISAALNGTEALTQWPVGSVVVKEGYRGDNKVLVAIMKKQPDGSWYWTELDSEGEPLWSGSPPSICVDCHEHRKTYSDWVYAFELPR